MVARRGHSLYCLEVHRPACGTLLGKTFAMIGRQFAENYEQVRLAAVLTAQPCSSATRNPRPETVASLPRVGGLHHRYEWREAA
jgi:hypothetical protein